MLYGHEKDADGDGSDLLKVRVVVTFPKEAVAEASGLDLVSERVGCVMVRDRVAVLAASANGVTMKKRRRLVRTIVDSDRRPC